MSYAGDVSCKECFKTLKDNSTAQLVDVRTMPEWMFVGIPNLGSLDKQVHTIEWQQFPTMQINSNFVAAVEQAMSQNGADRDAVVFCLCRSGVRSIAAAQALTAAGFANAYNVLEGFEGNHDEDGKRGTLGGWKFHDLPWSQQ